jgi:hypothetical protein
MTQGQDQKAQDPRLDGSDRLRARVIGVVSSNWVHTTIGVKFDERYFMDLGCRQGENHRLPDWIATFNTTLQTRFAGSTSTRSLSGSAGNSLLPDVPITDLEAFFQACHD